MRGRQDYIIPKDSELVENDDIGTELDVSAEEEVCKFVKLVLCAKLRGRGF